MTISVQSLGRDFSGVAALDDISFEAKPGSITAVIGPNGAGKTTLINLMSGHLTPTRGDVLVNGRPVTGLSAHGHARLGIARTFQRSRVFSDMTVMENMILGQYSTDSIRPRRRRNRQQSRAEALAVLQKFGLEDKQSRIAENLSHGDQRRVEIARALVSKPSVLLLDEPAAGMSGDDRNELKRDLAELVNQGLTILLVEHDLELVMSLADHVVVFDFGTIIAQGRPDVVTSNPEVQRAYMGNTHD